MKKLKKFFMPLLFYFPFSAMAITPAVVAIVVGVAATVVAGFSIYRSAVPVSLSDNLAFFSSCWSCGVFSDVLRNISEFIPKIYTAIGDNMVVIATGLTFVWFVWMILWDYLKVKAELDAWKITSNFTTHIIKLAFVSSLFLFPLPRFMMNTFITPIMNIGFSYNYIAKTRINPDDVNGFNACMLATALNEPAVAKEEAFSPRLRHNVTCQIATFHQITGLGMTLGATFAQMAFSGDYMYGPSPAGVKIPVFPNVGLFLIGIVIMLMFLWALIPIPIYFLKTFIKLSMDLVMLPFMLLGWLFSGWKNIFPVGGKTIKQMIDEVVKDTLGIALAGLLTGFAVLFLGEVIGDMDGAGALTTALQNNDSRHLMDALMLNNTSLINVIFAGLFTGMFMNAIPKLTEDLFKGVKVPDGKDIQETLEGLLKTAKKAISTHAKIIATGKAEDEKPESK